MGLIKKKELHLHRLTNKTFYSVKQESTWKLTKTWSEPSANIWTCEIQEQKFGARGHQAFAGLLTALLSVKLNLMAAWMTTVWSIWASIFFFHSTQIETSDGTILVDYSKNIITEETMKHLMDLVCFKWLFFKHFIRIKRWQRSLFFFFFGRPKQGVLKVLGIRCSLGRKLILLRFV